MMDWLYKNIGDKIKGLAKWSFVIGSCAMIGGGMVLIFDEKLSVGFGFFAILIGLILLYLSSVVLYAFGELVQRTCDNEDNTRSILKSMNDRAVDSEDAKGWVCPRCQHINSASVRFCTQCGESRSKKRDDVFNKQGAINGEWRCSQCGRVNKNYICRCGNQRP